VGLHTISPISIVTKFMSFLLTPVKLQTKYTYRDCSLRLLPVQEADKHGRVDAMDSRQSEKRQAGKGKGRQIYRQPERQAERQRER
jgi:hypothetical protein